MTTDTPVVACRRRRLGEWIDTHFGGVQAEFVAATGINQGELSGLLRTKSFGEKKARSLECQAKMPAGYLDQIDGTNAATKPVSPRDATISHALTNQRKQVRVTGAATMDKQGFWKLGSTEAELWEVNTDDQDAYALRILTQHFYPVVAPGQCLLVSPSQEPKNGRGVLVTLSDGRQSFRTLRSHEYGMWHFSAVNDPAAYLDLPDDQVSSVERVMSVSWTD